MHEGRSKCSKGRREARVVRLDGTGGSQRVKRQREGRSKKEIARGWAQGDEEGWKERRNGTRGREQRKRSVSCPALSVVLLLP